MIDQMQPAIWVLVALIAVGVSQVVGAFLTRKHYRRLNEIYDFIKSHPQSNDADKAWVRGVLNDALDRSPMWAASLGAPVLALTLPVVAVIELAKKPTFEAIEGDLDEMMRTRDRTPSVDPATGHFWRSELRAEANDHAFAIDWKQSPLLSVWVGLWLLPGFLLSLALAGLMQVSLRQFRLLATAAFQKFENALAHKA